MKSLIKMNLTELIIERIQKTGSISFRDFMEMALYEPELGYFTSGEHTIGKKGDFFTSPYISPAFGAMVGRQLMEIREQLDNEFTIVEYGGGAGLLCHDIIQFLKKNAAGSIQYVILEKSPYLRRLSQQYLPQDVIWLDDIEMLGSFQGCVISNELFDNFPVQRVMMKNGRLMELFVDFRDGFVEILKPATEELKDYLETGNLHLPEGHSTEICLDAARWYRQVSASMKKGYIVTIDYGYHANDLLQPLKSGGTVRCYYRHEMHSDPYTNIGNQDITADVNFSILNDFGTRNGFEFSGYVSQNRFLRALGFIPFLSDLNDSEENKLFTFDTLLHQMGNHFKVLIQRKALPYRRLQGLAFELPGEKRMFSSIPANADLIS
jgi:SAM-dependent MidA family methyltransferase